MSQTLLRPPDNDLAEFIINRFHLHTILERLPSGQVLARMLLLIVMTMLLLGDVDTTNDYSVWLTLPYMVLLLHIINLVLGVYIGFFERPTEVIFKNNKNWMINDTRDLEVF